MNDPFVSIIIPYPKDNPYLRECMDSCIKLDYLTYEIILLPDEEEVHDWPHTKVIPTGKIGPSEKRDIGLAHAKGEIVAFIDDDTFPVRDWLKHAVRHFEDREIAAVGGPAVTPPQDGLWQQASGAIYESPLVSGKYTYRYLPKRKRVVDDYPSCNLIIRRQIMEEIGGYDSNFYPGEDTVICLKITRDLKKKILYDPEVLVYHHRRDLFRGHLRQIKNYALHRGYFVKKFPETSLRLAYFVPTLFTIGISLGWLVGLKLPLFMSLYVLGVAIYLSAVFSATFSSKNDKIKPHLFFGIITTHLTYGFWFLIGLFSNSMREERKALAKSAVPVS